jgi:hypothetical protein
MKHTSFNLQKNCQINGDTIYTYSYQLHTNPMNIYHGTSLQKSELGLSDQLLTTSTVLSTQKAKGVSAALPAWGVGAT